MRENVMETLETLLGALGHDVVHALIGMAAVLLPCEIVLAVYEAYAVFVECK